MRSRIRKALLDNLALKLAALTIAIVLFAIVRGDRGAVTTIHAKVVYLYPADRVLMSEPVSELRITVRGPGSRLAHLDEHDMDLVKVDLRDARDGELRFGEDMVRLPPGLRVEALSPQTMQLAFEPRVEREVAVQPVIAGDPAPGFRVMRSASDPPRVTVSGARSVVDLIARAPTRPLRIAETRESVRGDVDLAPPPPHSEWRVSGPVTVSVDVEAALGERVVRGLAVQVTGLQKIEAFTQPAVADVVLRGPVDALARVGAVTLLVDGQAEDARPPGIVVRKRIGVAGLPPGVAFEVRPEGVMLFTRRRRD